MDVPPWACPYAQLTSHQKSQYLLFLVHFPQSCHSPFFFFFPLDSAFHHKGIRLDVTVHHF